MVVIIVGKADPVLGGSGELRVVLELQTRRRRLIVGEGTLSQFKLQRLTPESYLLLAI